MSRASLIFLLLFTLPALAAEPCGNRLQAFNTYEMLNDERKIEKRISVYPLPEEWSDASAFKGLLIKAEATALEVELQGKKKSFPLTLWQKDGNLLQAEGFQAKKIFNNLESGEHFILRLKAGKTTICEERREIAGH